MTNNLNFASLRRKNIQRCTTPVTDKGHPGGFGHSLESWSVAEWGNAAAGECGEACNVAKKMLRFRDGVAGNKYSLEEYKLMLASEIAGTLIYLDLWSASQGIDLAQAVVEEFNKKSDEIGSEIKL